MDWSKARNRALLTGILCLITAVVILLITNAAFGPHVWGNPQSDYHRHVAYGAIGVIMAACLTIVMVRHRG